MADVADFNNADFETAIAATGWGKFNLLAVACAFPAMLAIMADTASIAFVIPSGAECDLNLTNENKGALIAAVYFGMICSAIPWAYFADTIGRRPIITYGLITDACIVIISSTSQHWVFLMLCRFFSGVCICGPFASLYTYLSETNPMKMRHPIILVVGIFLSVGALLLPLLAMAVIPPSWEIAIGNYKYHSWHLYLFLCAMPGLTGGICYLFFPESPKFLMTHGKDDEALKIFTKIHDMNYGTKGEYPVTALMDTQMVFNETEGQTLTRAGKAKQQFVDILFSREYFCNAIMVFSIDFCVMMCQNTVRLWVPQILKLSKELENMPEHDQSLCGVLDYSRSLSVNMSHQSHSCKNIISAEMYVNNLYIGIFNIVTYLLAIAIVNKIGVKLILIISMGLTSVFAASLYFTQKAVDIVALITVYLSLENIASTNVVAASTSLFPTQVRATVVSMALLIGRIGSMLGNAGFPLLLNWGCVPTIAWITLVSAVAFVVSIFIRNPTGVKLK